MVNIGIITSTRADFGLLKPLIEELRKYENEQFEVSLIVTGMHLDEKYGYTIQEIIESNLRIDEKISIIIEDRNAVDIAKNQADTLVKFTQIFYQRKYQAICILGDRYEMQMIAIAAMNVGIPIFHLCGGDTTEGAIDEAIRHTITKMSYWHFTTNEESRKRVIQMGENPDRVYNVGSTSIDNVMRMPLMDKESVLASVGLNTCRFAIGTYHPVTLENREVEQDIMEFINAIEAYPEIEFIITKANADKGGSKINEILDREEKRVVNLHVFASLGTKRYLSLVKNAEFILGNSSSGIVEAPALHVPTINIGDRQRGRLQSDSVINCGTTCGEIISAINVALNPETKQKVSNIESLYGDGNAAKKMTKIIREQINKPIDLKKSFYTIKHFE